MFFSEEQLCNERYFNLLKDVPKTDWFMTESYTITKPDIQILNESTFLSHCSQDIKSVDKIYEYIKSTYNEYVYIDKADNNLPYITNQETARILKKNIKECKKFVLLVTEHSKNSCWIPWELGYADGIKSTKDIAIFPCNSSLDSGNNLWAGREYLGLYPRIVFSRNASDLKVVHPNNRKGEGMLLRNWFKL